MTSSLQSLYDWFDINRDSLIKNHENERILIFDNKNLGYFSNELSAVNYAKQKGLKLGSFLVQRCISAEKEEQMFYNVNLAVSYAK